MAYTVLQLITMAYFEAGINARDLNIAGGSQFNDGLIYFNEILAKRMIDMGSLPYYQQYEFTLEAGVETTFIENLVECELLTFFKDSVRYSVGPASRREYWGGPKPTNVQTLPGCFTLDRVKGGSNISVTFSPDQDYPAMLWGLFALESATLNTDLTTIYDTYYITYLRLDLVRSLCMSYNQDVPEGVARQFAEYDREIRKRSAVLDLKNDVISTLSHNNSINYDQINILKQFTAWSRR